MPYAWKVEPGSKVKLSEFDPSFDGGMDKDKGKAMLEKLGEEISELQELLFVTGQTALLCVFQGRDTAGKDGAINRVLTYTNAQGVHTSSFKVAAEVEER